MKYKLLNEPNLKYNAIEQVLFNRGINFKDMRHYLNTTDEDINNYNLFGENKLKDAAAALIKTISQNKNALIIIDCDCDRIYFICNFN